MSFKAMTMAQSKRDLPDTMVSPKTGEMLRRAVRPFIVPYKGRSITVELLGYYSDNGGGAVHVGGDMAVTDVALRMLKEEKAFPHPSRAEGWARS
jgi:HTH-type transcriptional regulator / antitoxin MqsA